MQYAKNAYPYRRKMIKLLVKHGMDLGEEEARLRAYIQSYSELSGQRGIDFDSDLVSCVWCCIRPIDDDDVEE